MGISRKDASLGMFLSINSSFVLPLLQTLLLSLSLLLSVESSIAGHLQFELQRSRKLLTRDKSL